MTDPCMINTSKSYMTAEMKAKQYFQALSERINHQHYTSCFMDYFNDWKRGHFSRTFSHFLKLKRPSAPRNDYHSYLRWLERTGKLDDYLDRSISYIYMRDLGQTLESNKTRVKIDQAVNQVKKYLIQTEHQNPFHMKEVYRWAQKEGIESTFFWLMAKLQWVSSVLPDEMDKENAQRKLIKLIAGVVMQELDGMDQSIPYQERSNRLARAIRIGYCYGLSYPFIDDLLDANVLSAQEKEQFASFIRTSVTTGEVPPLAEWNGNHYELMEAIHLELREAFAYMKDYQDASMVKDFFEQSYVFFHSQEIDRNKHLSNTEYTNEELYIPVMIKSSASRMIVRYFIDGADDPGRDERLFFYGIYNQLADDLADMADDMATGTVTPYTYYWKYHKSRPDLINPFELYWAVISYLIDEVYHKDKKSRDLLLNRAINGLKRLKDKLGQKQYNQIMRVFGLSDQRFQQTIQHMVQKANDVDFFDKLLRDHFLRTIRTEKEDKKAFESTIESVRQSINQMLSIDTNEHAMLWTDPITDAANYSLESDGKRIRPIMTWVMAIQAYQLDEDTIIPLLRSLEYMHTASLIYDDLPSQDNAPIRRGRQTLHEAYNPAIAELTGLFMTQRAVQEQASMSSFDADTILELITYSTQTTQKMCKGQAIDLESKNKRLTVEELRTMCFYKTGIGVEACLMMPAILAGVSQDEREALQTYAYHTGVAFQIKDDLLDVEGDQMAIGKPSGIDQTNQSATFVSILGIEGAKKEMWEHYCRAMESLQKIPHHISFLKQFASYMINRGG
ncbi:geranyltranstransferase [Gracilibacillus halophilus YIM-C55.5]|uniref:Geranyltranstransferase n=1 Tax=Gracilibacillus halophilus YIM-C55.5 TaxID=1308866 RepID=N4WSF3_9BACI|nr:polyprenyl synthetase family protein [Gracilibacillus halophilus]ENH96076.1 geranyltranstransferase [Gracilibacillus halophilus YIM-C55.5]